MQMTGSIAVQSNQGWAFHSQAPEHNNPQEHQKTSSSSRVRIISVSVSVQKYENTLYIVVFLFLFFYELRNSC